MACKVQDDIGRKEETVKKDVTVKNVEDIIQQNKKHLDEEVEFKRRKRIEKDLNDLQETVNIGYLDSAYTVSSFMVEI